MRIRTVKPEFWSNEDLSRVSPEAALLAIGLLNYADDEGYFNANIGLIKASVFPLRECSVNVPGMLRELSTIDYIAILDGTDGRRYGHILKFLDHQRINKPTPSKIKGLIDTTVALPECSVNATVGLRAGMEWKGMEGKGDTRARDHIQEDKDKEADPDAFSTVHPLVAYCLKLWPKWPRDQVEQSVMAWKSAGFVITEEILNGAKAYQNPREPYSRNHGCIARQAQFAARDAVRDGEKQKATAGRPIPKYEPSVEDVPETAEQEAERLKAAAECKAKIKELVGGMSLPEGEE